MNIVINKTNTSTCRLKSSYLTRIAALKFPCAAHQRQNRWSSVSSPSMDAAARNLQTKTQPNHDFPDLPQGGIGRSLKTEPRYKGLIPDSYHQEGMLGDLIDPIKVPKLELPEVTETDN